jgi:NADPH-dependent 2,4-dienoyl-CoA reductase/sulfur reductase-like enzyme
MRPHFSERARMRIQLPGIRRDSSEITFVFEGQTVPARPGETVAAALLNAGHRELRESHVFAGKHAGMFCGMGVCGECIVLVDGARRRACMEPVKAGLRVTRHPARAPIGGATNAGGKHGASATRGFGSLPELTVTPDVLVVGAGPAGLSAARVAARVGLDVLIVDERRAPGGQYFKQPNAGFELDAERLDAQFRQGRELIESVRRSGAQLLSQATVWGAFAPWQLDAQTTLGRVCVSTPSQRLNIQPQRLVIAAGAYERSVPFPGWDLPGVMTTGAAQTLLRANQLAPGARVLIAGNGPLNFQVAREITNAGADVVALAEAAAAPRVSTLPALMRMGMTAPRLIAAGCADRLALWRRNIKVRYRHAIVRVTRAEGTNGRSSLIATLARIDDEGHAIPASERHFTADAVCVGYGFLPQSEIARALGCAHSYDLRRGGPIVQRDGECRTSVPEIFVAGDAGGLGGAHIAMSQGTLAGLAVARDLGKAPNDVARRDARVARGILSRHARFQSALWSLFRAPLLVDQLADDDTPICRCEGVTKRSLAALLEVNASIGAIKRQCRAGMGGCQGRYCATLMAELVRRRTGAAVSESDLFAPRPPFRPTPVGILASSEHVKA